MRSTVVILFLCSVAHAQDDPDTEIARKHFTVGQALYDDGHYREAVREFEAAQAVHPTPLLDFNVARCRDRLEEWGEAVSGYERYLSALPGASDAGEVRERVALLKTRTDIRIPTISPMATVPPARRHLAPWLVGSAGLALAAVGAGLLGSAHADYGRLTCVPDCAVSDFNGIRGREYGGIALLGVAGAALAVDAVLWIVERRHR